MCVLPLCHSQALVAAEIIFNTVYSTSIELMCMADASNPGNRCPPTLQVPGLGAVEGVPVNNQTRTASSPATASAATDNMPEAHYHSQPGSPQMRYVVKGEMLQKLAAQKAQNLSITATCYGPAFPNRVSRAFVPLARKNKYCRK